MPGRLGTKGLRRSTAALSKRMANIVMGEREWRLAAVDGECMRNGRMAGEAEDAVAAASWHGWYKVAEGVRVGERIVSRKVRVSSGFCTA